MTTTNGVADTTTDDKLQELFDEADTLLQDLNIDGEDLDVAALDDAESPALVIDGFAIDSDEEADNNNKDGTAVNKSVDVADHPLSEEWLATPAVEVPAVAPSGTGTINGTGGNSSNSPMANATTSTIPSPLAAAATMDNFKQQTSRFASNLANMAQRAASQVAAATAVQPAMGGVTAAAAAAVQPLTVTGGQSMMSNHLQPTQQQYPKTNMFGRMQQQQQLPEGQQQASAASPLASYSQSQVQPQAQQQTQSNGGTVSNNGELDKEQKTHLLKEHVGEMLPGERVIMFLSNLLHVSDSSGVSYVASQSSDSYMWCCVMTYYRLILFCTAPKHLLQPKCPSGWNPTCWPTSPNANTLLDIPLASLDRVEKTVYQAAGSSYMGLVINAKDCGRVLRFTTPSYADTGRAFESLNTYAFPGRRNLGYLFAFESKRQKVMASIKVDEATGQQTITIPPNMKRFDPMIEFPRLLANAHSISSSHCPWTLWASVNASYQLSPTYPSVLVGPATIDETKPESVSIIRQCAAFRSEQRLPALAWCGMGGSSIWRCSQPKVGLQGNRSAADELFLRHVVECARNANAIAEPAEIYPRQMLQQLTGDFSKDWTPEHSCGLKILDLRPRSSAMANRTGGYGYENTSNYSNITLQFCNIGNIHAVRDSYQKLCALTNGLSTADISWNALVEDTKWLSHIRLILAASWETAYWAHVWRMPVLLHCSHGWDRTSQVSALAQLLLDPYYRTQKGFATLIEKDFMSFGHPFHTRCAHGEGRSDSKSTSASSSTNDEGQISPIFLQFIDCVYQIVNLFPDCFEFNTTYLLKLSFHIYSCRFGNMLCDTEREREVLAGIRQRTYSIWDYLESRPDLKNKSFTENRGVLLMPQSMLLRNVTLWFDRHCPYGPKQTMRQTPVGTNPSKSAETEFAESSEKSPTQTVVDNLKG